MINKKDKKFCKQFGIIISIIIFLLSVFLFQFKSTGSFIGIFLGILALLISFQSPKFFLIPCFFWSKLGNLLGHFGSFLIIGFLMYLIITPLKIMFRLNSNSLNKNFKKKNSYWFDANKKKCRFKLQY